MIARIININCKRSLLLSNFIFLKFLLLFFITNILLKQRLIYFASYMYYIPSPSTPVFKNIGKLVKQLVAQGPGIG